ncbi:MAG: Uma2 family endonuclease [Labilithrix sp.]|nr:Uma2 family endonuclease [Labilithrix sp.]
MAQRAFDELVPVPRSAVRFPLELPVPAGFVADALDTWPLIDGQLEFVGGKLLYLPPSADRQQDTTVDVITTLGTWRKTHRDFVVAANEAGMVLGGETRAADAAVWRRDVLGGYEGKYRRVPPILSVEVQGELEDESMLRAKAGWYLAHGVEVVWLLFPAERRVLVIDAAGERALGAGDQIPARASLPDLTPRVEELFEQVERG